MQHHPLIIKKERALAERPAHPGLVTTYKSVLRTSSNAESTQPARPRHKEHYELCQCVSRVGRLDAYDMFRTEGN